MIKRPNSRVNLDRAIERIFGNYEKSTEIRSIMANTIVGQMLPEGEYLRKTGTYNVYGVRM